jgi:hypothetical protein
MDIREQHEAVTARDGLWKRSLFHFAALRQGLEARADGIVSRHRGISAFFNGL